MVQEGSRRKKPHLFDILVVPLGEGGKTRKFRAGWWKLGLAAFAMFAFSVIVTLVVLVFTPVAMYVPIPNPGLEHKYGKQIVETQQRLNKLAEDVLLLKDYNLQLRKALGESDSKDSSAAKSLPPSVFREDREVQPPSEQVIARPAFSNEPSPTEDETSLDTEVAPYSVITTNDSPGHAKFPLLTPAEGFVTQGFDPSRGHFGMDFAGKQGTPVYAATDGHVVFSGWTYDDGNMVILSHGGGYLTVYKHNRSLLIGEHAVVRRGEPIALLGTSGKTSLGPHLHFEVWKDGVPQNPAEYLLSPPKM